MASFSKTIIAGNLGANPESRYMPDGTATSTFSVATSERWKDKNSGEIVERTEWHRVVFFGKIAEVANQYLSKGSSVLIEGQNRTRKWTDKAGIERYTTEIRGSTLQMLDKKPGDAAPKTDDMPPLADFDMEHINIEDNGIPF